MRRWVGLLAMALLLGAATAAAAQSRQTAVVVLGIAYANAHPEETNRILADLSRQQGWTRPRLADSITRYPKKPYPDIQAVANAYELACMQAPETRTISPLALWNMRYLRDLDDSGFIDKLYS